MRQNVVYSKYHLAANAAKFCFEQGLCKKPPAFHLAACAAKCYFKQTSFSLILLRKINENDVCLKFYFAAVGDGILFTQPLFTSQPYP